MIVQSFTLTVEWNISETLYGENLYLWATPSLIKLKEEQ